MNALLVGDIKKMLKEDEGLRLLPYRDTEGHLTIGYGHNLDAKGIALRIAEQLLDKDIEDAEKELDRELPWWRGVDAARQLVLLNLCFNMGVTKLLQFRKTLVAMEKADWTTATHELRLSLWIHQVGVKRSGRILSLLEFGTEKPEGDTAPRLQKEKE